MAPTGKWSEKIEKNLRAPLEAGPGKPLVEIYAGQRVLIEHHRGVLRYECNEILVKLSAGTVLVEGTELKLARVAREQLVICGKIACVRFCRGDG